MLSVWAGDSTRLQNLSTLRHLSNFTRHGPDKKAEVSGGPTYEVEWTLYQPVYGGLLFKSEKSLVPQRALPILNPALSAFTVAFQKAKNYWCVASRSKMLKDCVYFM